MQRVEERGFPARETSNTKALNVLEWSRDHKKARSKKSE